MPEYNFTIGDYSKKPNKKFKILTGQRFGRFLVIGHAGKIKRCHYWHVLCDCGNGTSVMSSSLMTGVSQSCGCLRTETTIRRSTKHGQASRGEASAEYRSYQHAKARCENPNETEYHRYGGRGIEFRFNSFEEFFAEVGRKPTPRLVIDRIDNDGHYEKGNLRWVTYRQSMQNCSININLTFNGITQCIAEWARTLNMKPHTIIARNLRGWCLDCTLTVFSGVRGNCTHKTNNRPANPTQSRHEEL